MCTEAVLMDSFTRRPIAA